MKLLFCIKQICNFGGMERVLINRVNYLIKKEKYEIYIVITDQGEKEIFFQLDKRIKVIDLKINYDENNQKNFFSRILNFFLKQKKHKKKLKEIFFEYKPNIIISFGNEDKYLIYKIKYKCKKILEHHFEKNYLLRKKENFLHKLKNYYLTKKEEKLLKKYDEFLVLTNEDKSQWKNEKIKVIPNPLTFSSSKVAKLENKKVISVGRLEYQKGYDILIEVWNLVIKKHEDWILEIYGEGNERKKLEEKIKKFHLEKNIFLKGAVKNIEKKYLESSIYIMTSRFEGMPMVLLEAAVLGLPIVSFDCPCGPKDIIINEINGYISKFGEREDMANKINALIENEELRRKMGKEIKKESLKYKEEEIMKQWEKLYSDNENIPL